MKTSGLGPRVLTYLALSLVAVMGVVPGVRAELNLDFDLVNSTGWAIKEIFIAPSSQEEWAPSDRNVLPESLKDGESVAISFHPEVAAAKWDLKIVWVDGGDSVEWLGFDLSQISKITLLYDEDSNETTAEIE